MRRFQDRRAADDLGRDLRAQFDPCYHAACDTFVNNNDHALDVNADAIAFALLTYAYSTESVNSVAGTDVPGSASSPLPARQVQKGHSSPRTAKPHRPEGGKQQALPAAPRRQCPVAPACEHPGSPSSRAQGAPPAGQRVLDATGNAGGAEAAGALLDLDHRRRLHRLGHRPAGRHGAGRSGGE